MCKTSPTRLVDVAVALLAVSGLWTAKACAQVDTVYVKGDCPDDPGNLNRAITTAAASGKLSQTLFVLDLNSRYFLRGMMTVPPGERLNIVAPDPGTTQETAPPQILWVDAGS
ncbi:MAG: hypothetical protein H5U38_01195, partial [Calditrichaeota bacterium]|nr:hypothetical protein [Calditrichota bacterium]